MSVFYFIHLLHIVCVFFYLLLSFYILHLLRIKVLYNGPSLLTLQSYTACLPPIMQQDYINLLRLSVAQLATEVYANDFAEWFAEVHDQRIISSLHSCLWRWPELK